MTKFLMTTALCTVLGLGVAVAQQTPPTAVPGANLTMDSNRFMPKQAADQVSTQDVVGAVVYGAKDAKIGTVNDLVMDSSGTVQVAVIGVGGFLGIGEKNVAVKFSEIQSRPDANGETRMTLIVTKEQLQAAPEYAFARDKETDAPATGALPSDREMPTSSDPKTPQ